MKFVAIRSTEEGSIAVCHQKNKKKIIKSALKTLKNYLSYYDGEYEIVINKLEKNSSDYYFYNKHIDD